MARFATSVFPNLCFLVRTTSCPPNYPSENNECVWPRGEHINRNNVTICSECKHFGHTIVAVKLLDSHYKQLKAKPCTTDLSACRSHKASKASLGYSL